MSGEFVTFEGAAELGDALTDLAVSTEKAILRRVAIKALEPFDAAWRDKVRTRTGKLKESGGVGTKLSARQKREAEHDSYVEVYAGPGPLVQAIQEEFGNRHEAPHPSVQPAWDETQGQVFRNVQDGLAPEIEKTAARIQARLAAKLAKISV